MGTALLRVMAGPTFLAQEVVVEPEERRPHQVIIMVIIMPGIASPQVNDRIRIWRFRISVEYHWFLLRCGRRRRRFPLLLLQHVRRQPWKWWHGWWRKRGVCDVLWRWRQWRIWHWIRVRRWWRLVLAELSSWWQRQQRRRGHLRRSLPRAEWTTFSAAALAQAPPTAVHLRRLAAVIWMARDVC